MTHPGPTPGQLAGDESALYERYGNRLLRVTSLSVNTAPDNVDDACSFAWTELVARQPRRGTVFAWLKTVARREALRLDRLARRVDSLEVQLEASGSEPVAARRTVETAHRMIEMSETLGELPDRLREVALLRGAGWSYAETADRLGISDTRVNQLVSRANFRLHEIEARRVEPRSDRAKLLVEIERDPPPYLVRAIGLPPRAASNRASSQDTRREWRRLALAVEDFRAAHSISDPRVAFGSVQRTPERAALEERISEFSQRRRVERGISR